MLRFYVSRHYVKWKGRLYKQGELLPEEFTHRDKARNIYSSRIAVCDVEDTAPEENVSPSASLTVEVASEDTKVVTPTTTVTTNASATTAGKATETGGALADTSKAKTAGTEETVKVTSGSTFNLKPTTGTPQ